MACSAALRSSPWARLAGPGQPEAVAAHHAQPRLDVVLIGAAAERARGHHHRLPVAQEPEQGVRFREGEPGRLLGRPQPPRPPHRGQRLRVPSFGQGRPRPLALRLAPPAEHGRGPGVVSLTASSSFVHREARSVCGGPAKRFAGCHSSAECHSGRVVYFRRLRFLTAGESHGPALTVIVEGLPAGLAVDRAAIDADLRRRQGGYGRGGRMKIESDSVEVLSGIRHGKTLGQPGVACSSATRTTRTGRT